MSANLNTLGTDERVEHGEVWHRLHSEREDICEALNNQPLAGDMAADDQIRSTWREGLLQARLSKIDRALDRLMSGTYGECSKCGKWIEDTKLDFDPAIEFCLGCWPDELRKAESERPTTAPLNGWQVTSTCYSVDQAFEPDTSNEVTLARQLPFASIKVQTLNSIYRIFLLDPKTSLALVEGGQYLPEPEETILGGSILSDGSFKRGWIGKGCRMQMWAKGQFLSTSPVHSIHVEHTVQDHSSANSDPQLVM